MPVTWGSASPNNNLIGLGGGGKTGTMQTSLLESPRIPGDCFYRSGNSEHASLY